MHFGAGFALAVDQADQILSVLWKVSPLLRDEIDGIVLGDAADGEYVESVVLRHLAVKMLHVGEIHRQAHRSAVIIGRKNMQKVGLCTLVNDVE